MLQVNAGDYILVWGEADDDGFFDGEMLDGRRGLVPSNFVERLEGEELADFHQQVRRRRFDQLLNGYLCFILSHQVILGLGDCDDSVCTSIPQDLDFISSDEGQDDDIITYSSKSNINVNKTNKTNVKELPRYASCTDLEMTEDGEQQLVGLRFTGIPLDSGATDRKSTRLNSSHQR